METRDYGTLEHENGGIKWPSAAAAGALVGAGLALLYAPRSGRETREALGRGMVKVKDGAGVMADKIKTGAEAVGQAVGNTASKLTGQGETEHTPGYGATGGSGSTYGSGYGTGTTSGTYGAGTGSTTQGTRGPSGGASTR